MAHIASNLYNNPCNLMPILQQLKQIRISNNNNIFSIVESEEGRIYVDKKKNKKTGELICDLIITLEQQDT